MNKIWKGNYESNWYVLQLIALDHHWCRSRRRIPWLICDRLHGRDSNGGSRWITEMNQTPVICILRLHGGGGVHCVLWQPTKSQIDLRNKKEKRAGSWAKPSRCCLAAWPGTLLPSRGSLSSGAFGSPHGAHPGGAAERRVCSPAPPNFFPSYGV